jgi:hypothetical protein
VNELRARPDVSPTFDPGITGFFDAESSHVALTVSRLSRASILWVNPQAVRLDPAFSGFNGSIEKYKDHLLKTCAFILPDGTDEVTSGTMKNETVSASADRYGGNGIGHNGGSGRNVFVNGYMVKGVGRTPLVSSLTDQAHASGGAYLEECIRETIFSEVIGRDFPFGGVPVLAIIDTGLTQTWGSGIWPPKERRTLLIRPPFLRPAHFERATGFVSTNHREGALDQRRVAVMFGQAIDRFGKDGLIQLYNVFWNRWVHQLAYAFVHRLPHGNNTSSNIAFDGCMVDFGATSAVPSWATIATSYYPAPLAKRFDCIASNIRSLAYFFGRHVDSSIAERAAVDRHTEQSMQRFNRYIVLEALRVFGVVDPVAEDVVNSKAFDGASRAIHEVISYFEADQLDFLETAQKPRKVWDLAKVWDRRPPQHLQRMRQVLLDLVPTRDCTASSARCGAISASRPLLYKPSMRGAFFNLLGEEKELGGTIDSVRLTSYIDHAVKASIREHEASKLRTPPVGAAVL